MSKLIFKQWLYSPNKKATSKALPAMMHYIATRPGVVFNENELSELSQDENFLKYLENFDHTENDCTDEVQKKVLEEVSPNKYMSYIATRPGVAKENEVNAHGLFGKLDGMAEMGAIDDLGNSESYVETIAKNKTTVYNAVISLKTADAIEKDMTTLVAWEKYCNSQINEIARKMNIPPRTLEWVGAVHMEEKHPHVHLMYWDTEQKIGVNFIEPEKSNDIRKTLTKSMFAEDLQEIYKQKDTLHQNLMERISPLLGMASAEELYEQAQNCIVPGSTQKLINRRTAENHVESLSPMLYAAAALIRKKQSSGALKYQYMNKEIKEEIDKISDYVLKNNLDIAKAYNSYLSTVKSQAEIYGGKENVAVAINKADKKLYIDIGNKVLNSVKELLNETPPNYEEAPPMPDEPPPISDSEAPPIYEEEPPPIYDEEAPPMPDELPPPPIYDEEAPPIYDEEPPPICDEEAPPIYDEEPPPIYNEEAPPEVYDYNSPQTDGSHVQEVYGDKVANKTSKYQLAKLVLADNSATKEEKDKAIEYLTKSAKQGNSYAQFQLGNLFLTGQEVKQDLGKSDLYFQKALAGFVKIEAESHDSSLQYRIGKMLFDGTGCDKNVPEAVRYYELSAKRDNQFAQYALGKLYLLGEDVPKDVDKAVEYLIKSAEQGNSYAQFQLGTLYFTGKEIPQDLEKSDLYFQKALTGFVKIEAESHDTSLQYRIGKMLFDGTGCDKNVPEAIKYYELSAKQGNQFAQYALGKLYLLGEDVEKDVDKAVEYLTKSAEQGNSYAQFQLGNLFLTGQEVKQDLGKSDLYFQKALAGFVKIEAESHDSSLQYRIGKMLFDGTGCDKNVPEAIKYYELSAKQDNQFAQYALGKLYLLGEDVPKDVDKAVEYLIKSAEQGNSYAQFQLGCVYLFGKDVPRNKEMAFEWLQKAAAQDCQPAKDVMYNDKLQDVLIAMNLFQNILNVITNHDAQEKNRHLFDGHDLTKAQKAELAKNQKETTIEWGD